MQVFVKPKNLSQSHNGILLGFQTPSELFVAMKIPFNTQVDFKEHALQITKLLCGGIYILGIATDSKVDDKSVLAKLDIINKMYDEKFPKLHFHGTTCRIYKKTLETVEYVEKDLKLYPVTTNLSIDISANKSSSDYEEMVKKGFMSHLELLEQSEYKITDSHTEVFYPTNSKSSKSFRPIKQGEMEIRVIAQLSSYCLGLTENITEIKKDLKKCLVEQLRHFSDTKGLTKRLYFDIGGLTFSDYNHVSFLECRQKFKDVLGLEMDPADERQFTPQQPISPKGIREKKKLVEVEEDEIVSNSNLMKKSQHKEMPQELPSNHGLIQKSQNTIKKTLESIQEESQPRNSSFAMENFKDLIEDITDQVENHPMSNSELLKKNVGQTVQEMVNHYEIPSNSTVLTKGVKQTVEKMVEKSIPSNSQIMSQTKDKVENHVANQESGINFYLMIGFILMILAVFLYQIKK